MKDQDFTPSLPQKNILIKYNENKSLEKLKRNTRIQSKSSNLLWLASTDTYSAKLRVSKSSLSLSVIGHTVAPSKDIPLVELHRTIMLYPCLQGSKDLPSIKRLIILLDASLLFLNWDDC